MNPLMHLIMAIVFMHLYIDKFLAAEKNLKHHYTPNIQKSYLNINQHSQQVKPNTCTCHCPNASTTRFRRFGFGGVAPPVAIAPSVAAGPAATAFQPSFSQSLPQFSNSLQQQSGANFQSNFNNFPAPSQSSFNNFQPSNFPQQFQSFNNFPFQGPQQSVGAGSSSGSGSSGSSSSSSGTNAGAGAAAANQFPPPPPVNEFQPVLPPLISPSTLAPPLPPPTTEVVTEGPTTAFRNKPEYPLPECYTNNAEFMCCNKFLEDLMHDSYYHLETSIDNWKNCNTQQISNNVQKKAEDKFGLTFEVISSIGDFASKSHFFQNYICKINVNERYILTYATASMDNVMRYSQMSSYSTGVNETQDGNSNVGKYQVPTAKNPQQSSASEYVKSEFHHFYTWKM